MKLSTKFVLAGLMVAFAIFWTIKPLRNAIIAPGSGACYECSMPWKFTEYHTTMIGSPKVIGKDTPGISIEGDAIVSAAVWGGVFVLCERCWTKLTPADRLPHYREWYDKWAQHKEWEAIKTAVLAGR